MANLAQRSFAGGEIAPALHARTDQAKYATGVRTLRNFLVQRHGGVANRAGTALVAETKASGAVRLIPFVFNTDAGQTYVLEFGELYVRFHQNGAQASAAAASSWVGGGFNYDPGATVERSGTYYVALQGSGGLYGASQDPALAPLYWYPLTGTILEIPTPYLASELDGLQFVQDADVMTIVHHNHPPAELRRLGALQWTLTEIDFSDPVGPPRTPGNSGGTAHPTIDSYYAITAVSDDTGQEGAKVTTIALLKVPDGTNPITVTWTAPAGVAAIASYRIFRSIDGATWGLVGTVNSPTLTFKDDGIAPDYTQEPPTWPGAYAFGDAGQYPGVVAHYQQRRVFANTLNEPEKVWMSKIGLGADFHTELVLADDDTVSFALRGRRVNEVRHLVDLAQLLLFSAAGEWTINGDSEGVITPAAVNPRQQGYRGASYLAPVIVGNSVLYVQARGSVVRNLVASTESGFQGTELTIFAAHLVDGYALTDWTFQEIPHSIVWAVRDDGVLLGLTYLREHEVFGWHRHDTDGAVERVCAIPEGLEDALYLVVKRTINGVEKRYVERMASRTITDRTDRRELLFLDCALTYDGRNTDPAHTVTLSGSSDWSTDALLTVTAAGGATPFSSIGAGDAIVLYDDDGAELLRVELNGVTSPTVATGFPSKLVPVAQRNVATSAWAAAADTFSGLAHLEGKRVGVWADGAVAASPNNDEFEDPLVVTGGAITLEEPAAVVSVGLAYLSDLETLDIDTPQGASLKDKKLLINAATLLLERSLAPYVGPALPADDDPLDGMDQLKLREASDEYEPVELRTGDYDVVIDRAWDSNGRLAVRVADPVPVTILAIIPRGSLPRDG